MVGISPKDNRPSYFAFKYLLERGYRMIPVNPGQAGKDILGQKVYAKLSDIPEPVDMVDVFRASQYAPAVVDEALTLDPKPQVIWMQLGVRNDEAAAKAEAAGIKVVMNRCPKIEYGRLSSEISWIGVNSRTLVVQARTAPGQRRAAHVAQPADHERRHDRRDRSRRARQGQRRIYRVFGKPDVFAVADFAPVFRRPLTGNPPGRLVKKFRISGDGLSSIHAPRHRAAR